MKKRDIEKKLKEAGFNLIRYGSNHDIWAKGEKSVSIPRHKNVNELTAMRILKTLEG